MYQNRVDSTTNAIISDKSAPETNPVTILYKISRFENGAIDECLKCYGNFVWAIAKKYTQTTDEAENAVREIFLDIWEKAETFDCEKFDERAFIARIALRRLLKINKQPIN